MYRPSRPNPTTPQRPRYTGLTRYDPYTWPRPATKQRPSARPNTIYVVPLLCFIALLISYGEHILSSSTIDYLSFHLAVLRPTTVLAVIKSLGAATAKAVAAAVILAVVRARDLAVAVVRGVAHALGSRVVREILLELVGVFTAEFIHGRQQRGR